MELFEALTAPKRASLYWWNGRQFAQTPWQEVLADATRVAAGLRRLGVCPGVPVASVLTNTPSVVQGILGVWLAGGILVSLPVPARAMDIGEYADQLTTLCGHVGSPVLLVENRLLEYVREPLAGRANLRAWESLAIAATIEPCPPASEELAFIQYSSGSTSAPKGCALTTRSIGNQLETLAHMLGTVPGEETFASWLPLSHDMGFFGCFLFSWAHDCHLALSSPERFIYDPRTWLGDCADFGATVSAGPCSALRVATRAQSGSRLARKLSLRACVIGAERIAWSVLRSATDTFAPYGLTARTWMPAYGMAEATLVLTALGLDDEPSYRRLDETALADGEIREHAEDTEASARIVSVGRPCLGVAVRTAQPDCISEIHIRSTSLAAGYYRDPRRSAERFIDGELATGDLGFMRDGELYIVGRADDMVSVAGRKVYAGEIEATVDTLAPVRGGCSTMVDVDDDGRARLVMLLELRDERVDCSLLAADISRMVKAKTGVLLDECIFLAKGELPKTPSGKIQRFRCRILVASEDIASIARVELRRSGGTLRKRRAQRPATTDRVTPLG